MLSQYCTRCFMSACFALFTLVANSATTVPTPSPDCQGVSTLRYPEDFPFELARAYHGGGTPIELEVKWKVISFLQEPVKYCVARWKFREDSTGVTIKNLAPYGPKRTFQIGEVRHE